MVTFTTSVDPNEMLLLCGISSVSTLFVKEKKDLKGDGNPDDYYSLYERY